MSKKQVIQFLQRELNYLRDLREAKDPPHDRIDATIRKYEEFIQFLKSPELEKW